MGRKKTTAKMLTRFFRPNLRERIEKFIRTCHTCQLIKVVPTQKAPIQFLQPERTNQIVTSDYAGPYPKTARGNQYIQVIVDSFGKTLSLIAVPDKEATTAAQTPHTQLDCMVWSTRASTHRLWKRIPQSVNG